MCDLCRTRSHPAATPAPAAAAPAPTAPTADAELLADRRVSLARMSTVRAGLALELQRGAGNAALARVLARDATAAPAKPKLRTGAQMDGMLVRDAFFKPYIAPKIKEGIKAEGHVHMHDPEAFKREAVKYLRTAENPKTDMLYSAAEAEAFEPELRAFLDDTEVHVSTERADDGTIVHESMHLFSSAAFTNDVGYHLNEGVTEHFARRLASRNGIIRQGFPLQFRLVYQLLRHLGSGGEKLLADAYFKNEVDPLAAALDARKGAGTWARFLAAMRADDLDAADEAV